MAKQFDAIADDHRAFIEAQHMFFCGSAAPDGRVNISPKGMDSLRVIGPNRIIWRNLTGSGNETVGHLLRLNRMTLMWCGFEARPMIMRAYGTATTLHPRDVLAKWADHKGQHGIETYWDERNRATIDGMPTHILGGTPDA
jgi:hypothetical protein